MHKHSIGKINANKSLFALMEPFYDHFDSLSRTPLTTFVYIIALFSTSVLCLNSSKHLIILALNSPIDFFFSIFFLSQTLKTTNTIHTDTNTSVSPALKI